MSCKDIQFDLSAWLDGELPPAQSARLAAHVANCAECRAAAAEFDALQTDLAALGRIERREVPAFVTASIQAAVAQELEPAYRQKVPAIAVQERGMFSLVSIKKAASESWLLPYGVGVFATALLLMFVLTALNPQKEENSLIAANRGFDRSIIMLPSDADDDSIISAVKYAQSRSAVAQESPSLNPQGSFVAATASLLKDRLGNKEIVFVADVLSNGVAKVTQVVEADDETMRKIERSLQVDNENSSAFVPASLDNRADIVTVIFKIQRVDVFSDEPRKRARQNRKRKI